jgi:hypothetical protein
MFIKTTCAETSLNQVSLKTSKKDEKKTKVETEFLLTDICPEIYKNKKKIKVDFKKCKENMEKFLESDYYKRCQEYWNRPKVLL